MMEKKVLMSFSLCSKSLLALMKHKSECFAYVTETETWSSQQGCYRQVRSVQHRAVKLTPVFNSRREQQAKELIWRVETWTTPTLTLSKSNHRHQRKQTQEEEQKKKGKRGSRDYQRGHCCAPGGWSIDKWLGTDRRKLGLMDWAPLDQSSLLVGTLTVVCDHEPAHTHTHT